MHKRSWVIGLILTGALGQSVNETARFEAASVKFRSQGGEPGSTGHPAVIRNFAGLLTYRDVTLKGVVSRAYNVELDLIVAQPWMDQSRFDIMARAPAGATASQLPAMLRNLLADRFKMRAHWESRLMSIYTLVVGKGGPKLTTATSSPPGGGEVGDVSITMSKAWRFRFQAVSMDVFAQTLSHWIGRPVQNVTDLPGYFDFSITASPESMAGPSQGSDASDPSGPSIFEAVKTLGLALEPKRGPVRLLLIDSAEKVPTAN